MKVYRIRDWDKHFENNRTRELKRLDWVPVPNRHDGDGFTELLDHKNGMAHYGAWHLILQVASRCDPRGTLLRDGAGGGKTAHDEHTLARITRGSASVIKCAIDRLLSIGWLEVYDDAALIPHYPAPACGIVTMEGKGREWNTPAEGAAGVSIPQCLAVIEGFSKEWQAYLDNRKAKKAKATPRAQELILATLAERPEQSVEALRDAITRNWTGIKWEWIDNTDANRSRRRSVQQPI